MPRSCPWERYSCLGDITPVPEKENKEAFTDGCSFPERPLKMLLGNEMHIWADLQVSTLIQTQPPTV